MLVLPIRLRCPNSPQFRVQEQKAPTAQGWGMAGLEGQGSKSQGSFAAPELSFPITNKTCLWTQCHDLVHLDLHHDLLSLS